MAFGMAFGCEVQEREPSAGTEAWQPPETAALLDLLVTTASTDEQMRMQLAKVAQARRLSLGGLFADIARRLEAEATWRAA